MQADLGKLFIGGISWETSEDRLKEYFSTFGEVVEAVIMKDRTTGRARGFGFIVFSDAAVADRVIKEKHNIDGRMVEAKKAVPRDDQTILSRNSSSVQGSPGPGRTRKIFVGGLASTVSESDFKKYFEQFGTITDVVVMYDHNTQRPRGFGFITYDSEEAVDRVLVKTFHELNGKMVEVKRAVPKELSPGPSRSPISGYNNYGLNNNNRLNSYVNGFSQGYGLGGYGVRMDARFDPIASGRSEFPPPFGSNYGMGMNYEGGVNGNYGGGSGNFGYGRGLNPYYMGNSVSNRFVSPVGYDGGNVGSTSLFSSTRNLWGNGGLSYGSNSLTGSTAFMGSGSGVNVGRSSNVNWGGSSAAQGQGGGGGHGGNGLGSSVGPGNLGYVGAADSSYNLVMRNNAAPTSSSYASSNGGGGYDGPFSDFYAATSFYGDPTWKAQATDRDASTSFAYALGNASPTSDVSNKASAAYVGGYTLTKRHSDTGTGIAS